MSKKNFTTAHSMYIEEMGKYKLFSAEEEREYFIAFTNETDPAKKMEIRNIILQANLRLVVSYVKKYYPDEGIDKLELINEGNIGLMKAIEVFDVSKGYKFSTYATWWIIQAITRYIGNNSNLVRVPVNTLAKVTKIKKYISEYETKNGEPPTESEIAKALNYKVSQVRNLMKIETAVTSLDATVKQDESDGATLGDLYNDITQPLVEDEFFKNDLKNKIRAILEERLTKKEIKILELRYGFNGNTPMTLAEVGEIYGVSRERIRQIEVKAFKKLKRCGRVDGLNELYENYV